MSGRKDDNLKLRYDLIPTSANRALANVLTFGAKKYDDRNWEQGIRWGRVFAAARRHMDAWWGGQDLDPETGYSHLDHAITNLAFLIEYERTHPEYDDRPTSTNPLSYTERRRLAKLQVLDVPATGVQRNLSFADESQTAVDGPDGFATARVGPGKGPIA
jgi:hypothetical protein